MNVIEGDPFSVASYLLVLTSRPYLDVTVTVEPDSQLQAAEPSQLVFTNGNWSTPVLVEVSALDDAVAEVDPHPATISHSVSTLDSVYAEQAAPSSVVVSITDDDAGKQCLGVVLDSASETRC